MGTACTSTDLHSITWFLNLIELEKRNNELTKAAADGSAGFFKNFGSSMKNVKLLFSKYSKTKYVTRDVVDMSANIIDILLILSIDSTSYQSSILLFVYSIYRWHKDMATIR